MSSLIQVNERKRLFIGLLTASLLTAGGLALAVWYLIVSPQQSAAYQLVLLVLILVLVGTVVLVGFGLAGILLTLWLSKNVKWLQGPMRIALNTFFPLVLGVGKVFRIDMDRIRNSFVQVNNQLIEAMHIKLKPESILILAPHCLQRSSCPYKITTDIENCRRCGKCNVDDLLKMRDEYGVNIGMATGGTLARKYVKEYKPRAIVAIACERDLTSGILDANPIPVLGVMNIRPHGPCVNTCMNVPTVESAIQQFVR
ncbi:MAG: DUF116 domain-containing protein [Firmicutes bacterium]|nr:DUF116 domain-containing protein [Bacillota bacterium]